MWIEPDAPAESRWRAVGDAASISYSPDGIVWKRHAGVQVPDYNDMGGLDSQPLIFKDPACDCHALFTRIWCKNDVEWCKQISGGDPRRMPQRMVRRANIMSLDGNGTVGKQGVVMRADAVDLSAHTSVLAMSDMGYYGATAWVKELGGGQRVYFMAPVRYTPINLHAISFFSLPLFWGSYVFPGVGIGTGRVATLGQGRAASLRRDLTSSLPLLVISVYVSGSVLISMARGLQVRHPVSVLSRRVQLFLPRRPAAVCATDP